MSIHYNPHNISHFLLLQDYFPAVANWLKWISYICTCTEKKQGDTFIKYPVVLHNTYKVYQPSTARAPTRKTTLLWSKKHQHRGGGGNWPTAGPIFLSVAFWGKPWQQRLILLTYLDVFVCVCVFLYVCMCVSPGGQWASSLPAACLVSVVHHSPNSVIYHTYTSKATCGIENTLETNVLCCVPYTRLT